jgi:hypothetical protein
MNNNYDSQGFASFLRRDGTLPMTGDLNLQDTTGTRHNINSAETVNAQNVTAVKRVTAGEFVQINGVATPGGKCSPSGLFGRNSNGAPLFCQSGVWTSIGNYDGTYQVGTARQSTGWIRNDSAKAITINAFGGNNPDANRDDSNPCELTGHVNTVGIVAKSVNNNPQFAKRCFISFTVPSAASWMITSTPYRGNTGFFQYRIFTPN